MAVVGGATVPAGPAVAAPFVLTQNCSGGSGATLSNVNCANSIASPAGSLIGAALPDDLAAILKALNIDLNSSAVVVASNGTATISGTGFALAAQALNVPLFGGAGGSSTANAVTPLSAAIAVGTGKGNASATAVSGVAVAASGSGSASAVSVGGVATAINILGMKNVTCTALYGRAGADGVGSCTSVLYVFTAKNAAGSDVWTYAIADPTSFTVAADGGLPIPRFTRDLVRVSVGGPAGVVVGTDLFSLPTTSKSAVSLSSRAATTVSKPVAAVLAQAPSGQRSAAVPSVVDDVEASTVASESATTAKHRMSDAESTSEVAVPSRTTLPTFVTAQSSSVPAPPASVTAQSSSVPAQSTGVGAQLRGLRAQLAGGGAQSSSATAHSTGGEASDSD